MANDPWAGGGGGGGGGGDPWGGGGGRRKKEDEDDGFWGTVKHVVTQGPMDIVDMLLESPEAAKQIHLALAELDPTNLQHIGHSDPTAAKQLAKGTVIGFNEMRKHPLRHPGDTLVSILPVVGGGSRALAAGRMAARGATVGTVAKTLVKPPIPDRVIKVGGEEVRGHYSRSVTGRTIQRGVDKAMVAAASKSRRAETRLHARAGKWNDRALRVKQAKANAPGIHLAALGEKLDPAALWALRMVAEEVPVERAMTAAQTRLAKASSNKALTRHENIVDLTERAAELLDEGPNGVPVIKAEFPGLQSIFDDLKAVSDTRGEILAHLRLMTKAAQDDARLKQAQLRAGGQFVSESAARAGARTIAREARRNTANLDRLTNAELRDADKRVRDLDAMHERAARRAFAVGTQRTAAERAAMGEAQRANRAAERASSKRYKNAPRAAIGARAHGLVRREQRLAQIAWERFQRGEIGPGKLDRAQRRLARLTDEYEKHAGSLLAMREAERAGEKALPEQEATLARLRAEEARRERDYQQAIADEKLARNQLLGAKGRRAALAAVARNRREVLRARAALAMVEQLARANRVVGAEDIQVSEAGAHIGSQVQRTRILGRPVVTYTNTFGRNQPMGSLRTSKGYNIAEAAERTDTTNIVAERLFEATRFNQLRTLVNGLRGMGTTRPTRRNDVWVWTDEAKISDRLDDTVKEFLQGPKDLADVPDHEATSILHKIRKAMMEDHDWKVTDPDDLEAFEQAAAEGKGFFISRKLLGNAGRRSSWNIGGSPIVKVFDAINNAQKVALVYAKPSYLAAQGLSNAAMGFVHQGFAYPLNLTRASKLSATIGSGYVGVIDELMGQGAVVQAALSGSGKIATASRKIADVMSSIVDVPTRRSAWIHEANKLGYKTPEDIRRLLDDPDGEHLNDLVEITQRAKEGIVDYGELGPIEQNVIRRLIFVYPWQKGAMKWAYYFFRDHPLQAAVLNEFSNLGLEERRREIGPVPSYLRGVIPVGDDRLINPAAANPLQTPAHALQALGGYLTGNRAAPTGAEFFSPLLGIGISEATRRDTLDRPLEGNILQQLRQSAIQGIPLQQVLSTFAKNEVSPGLGGFLGAPRESQTFPNAATTDPYWRFLFSGMYPREYDPGALEKAVGYETLNR